MPDLFSISMNVLGETQYDRAFVAFEHEVNDLSEPLGRVRDLLREHTVEQFDTEGHGGWVQLNPDYERWKQAHYPGKPILQRTGALREQLVDHGTIELGPHRLVWGVHPGVTNEDGGRVDVYGAAHQTGNPDGGLPQRKIIDTGPDDRREIDRVFVSWLNDLRHLSFGGHRA